jgi:hypothetical protein
MPLKNPYQTMVTIMVRITHRISLTFRGMEILMNMSIS